MMKGKYIFMSGNYKRLIIASSIVYASMGIFTPAWYLYLTKTGGSLQFGVALGLMAIAGGVTSYVAGHLSDKKNKVTVLLFLYLLLAITVSLYAFVHTVVFIYLLQIAYGVLSSSTILLENVLASMLTLPEKRGKGMGLFSGTQQVVVGVSMLFGGGLAGIIGLSNVFFLTSAFLLVGVFVVSKIKMEGGGS